MKNIPNLSPRVRIVTAVLVVTLGLSAVWIWIAMSPAHPEPIPGCADPAGQTVTRWKDMYWFPCRITLGKMCIWPIRRRHITYKVTISEGQPLRDEKGRVLAIAKGQRRDWLVYDAAAWNALAEKPLELSRYPDFEPIAENEYVVAVETRYRWFNNVEASLRLCTVP